jgi:hypothetical protein
MNEYGRYVQKPRPIRVARWDGTLDGVQELEGYFARFNRDGWSSPFRYLVTEDGIELRVRRGDNGEFIVRRGGYLLVYEDHPDFVVTVSDGEFLSKYEPVEDVDGR